jgi:aspartate carbamoyltransferase
MTLPFTSLVSAEQLTPDVIAHIFGVADSMQKIVSGRRRSDLLADSIIALIFLEPSSRTMLSFQAAAERLRAGLLLVHGKDASSLAKGESISDTMKLVTGYADLVVARLPETGAAPMAAAACTVPFINAGDGANEHPTQALIDLYTIRHELGTLEGLHIACGFDPKHSRTIHSLVRVMAQYKGTRFTFVSPDMLQPPPKLLEMLDRSGVPHAQTEDMEGLRDADVLYLNRLQEERFADSAAFDRHRHQYSLVPDMLTTRNRLILDPLPRVDEIATSVDELPEAAYFRQAHNGVPIRMALLSLLLGKQI